MNNTNRAVEIYKKNSDGTRKLVSNYCYVGNSDCKDNKSAELMVNPEGPEMLLKQQMQQLQWEMQAQNSIHMQKMMVQH